MNLKVFLAIAGLLGCLAPEPRSDVSYTLIEYRKLEQLGQIRVTAGIVHDPAIQDRMFANFASFDRQGLILVAGDSGREFSRSEKIGTHTVETRIRVFPPTGRGFGGGLGTADILVTVDGAKRVDCPFAHPEVGLDDVAILPADGMITVGGSVGGKRFHDYIFTTGTQAVNQAWLERAAK